MPDTTAKPWDIQPGETPKAYEAFCVYLNLGTARSNAKTGHSLGKSKVLIDRWSSRWSWVERVAAYDAERELERRNRREEADGSQEIRDYRKRARESAKNANIIGNVLLAKCAARLKTLEPDDLPPKLLAGLIRAAAQVMDASLNAEAQAIGADQLLGMLDEVAGADNTPAED